MANPVVGSVTVPASMRNSGRYKLIRNNTSVRNGEGILVQSNHAHAVWEFDILNRDEYDWWVARLGGAISAVISGSTILWDEDMDAATMITFTRAVLDKPLYQEYRNGTFRNVVISFTSLRLP